MQAVSVSAYALVILNYDTSIAKLLQVVLELEGYRFTVARDPAEALRLIEENAVPCVVLADNLKVNPAGRDALSTLRATPALQALVRVIGLDVSLRARWSSTGASWMIS